jgi:uncharacterized lipoprotein YddW (UPF0748 family)
MTPKTVTNPRPGSTAPPWIEPISSGRTQQASPTLAANSCKGTAFFCILGCLAFWAPDEVKGVAASATIDDCQYAENASAQAAWEPMRGTAPASVAQLDGRKVLRLACNFADTRIERASWDRKVNLDLVPCRGIQFKVLCHDASPVSHFSIYFQSGGGWYHAAFFPEMSSAWNTIAIDKTETTTEGRPAGWGHIETIRISAWRGKDANSEFYLSDLRKSGELGVDASVAIVRGESAAQRSPGEARSVEQFSEAVAQNLRALDIGCTVISDLDLTAQRLEQARLVVLPHNPSMLDRAQDALVQYVNRGGRLLAFYTVPDRLRSALRIEGGEHVKARYPGYFSVIRFREGALPGAPPSVGQQSWNINAVQPVAGASRVLADWLDDKGLPTGYAAVLGSTNFVVMTHVLLSDDATHKSRMLLAMAGYLVPEIWQQAAAGGLGRIGTIGGFRTYDEAAHQIAQLGRSDARVTRTLAAARALRESAIKLTSRQKFAEALEQATAASQRVKEAFCMAQRPWPGEFRAFWCHSAFGVEGTEWDEAVRRLADNGFTAILPNMLWGGAAFYESQVLPVAPQVVRRGDQIAQCLAACRKHGVQIHVWKVNWNLGYAVPKEFVEKMRREGRLQASSQRKEELWLCPSHPENQKLEIDSMVEVVRRYGVDGIHFDYIRYPDGDHCFCAGCQERFQRAAGVTVQHWPQDLLADGPFRQPWLDWRRSNITAVVKAVSEQARVIRPKIKLSAAVFRNWTTDRDGVGQDWKLWCEKGYLDFVCPMDYTPSKGSFENMVTQQVQWAGQTPCYPGIGVSSSSSHFGVDRVIEQINITRRHGTRGFIIFNYGAAESTELLPLLGLGITAKRW